MSPEKVYEKNLCEKLVEDLNNIDKEEPVFFDIGSNIGLISMYVLKNSKAKVFSFEPGMSQMPILFLNCIANKFESRWSINQYAISDSIGKSVFYSNIDHRHNGGDGLLDTGRSKSGMYEYKVNTITLDQWCRENNTYPDIIKIDVEGSELMVINGAEETISKHKPKIFLEISTINLKKYPYGPEDILKKLNDMGYDVFDMEGTKCSETNIKSLSEKDDLFVATAR
jgi:FkbM family methyltransferase